MCGITLGHTVTNAFTHGVVWHHTASDTQGIKHLPRHHLTSQNVETNLGST